MSDRRRGLGRGLGALIPTPPSEGARPVDVFFADPADRTPTTPAGATGASAEPPASAVTTEPVTHSTETDLADLAEVRQVDTEPPSILDPLAELVPVPGARFAAIAISAITPNPRQPRTVFDTDDLDELAASIAQIGVLQPIVVRPRRPVPGAGPDPSDDQTEAAYELVMGERRWRAATAAGLSEVPAIIRDTEDDDLLRDALLENLHRSQLNPLEEAAAYQQLLDDFGCTQEELATRIGRSRPQISNTLRLLRLPPMVARRVAAGVLSAGHARALLGLADGAAMERMAQRIVAEGLSVRTVEELVALGGDEEPATRRSPRPGERHPQLDDLAGRLSDLLETRARIDLGKRKGKVTIEFATIEDLTRILDAMGLAPESAELID